jgi:hypothetical protein
MRLSLKGIERTVVQIGDMEQSQILYSSNRQMWHGTSDTDRWVDRTGGTDRTDWTARERHVRLAISPSLLSSYKPRTKGVII